MKLFNQIRGRFLFPVLFLLLCFSTVTNAAEDSPDNYVATIYNNRTGMPTSEANTIVQSEDGFIWIGAYSGIFRYDGAAFTRFSTIPEIINANSLLIDHSGRMWIGSNDSGVAVYQYGDYTLYTQKDGIPASSIQALAEDSHGTIYVATTSGVCSIQIDGSVCSYTNSIIGNQYIHDLSISSDDTVYCITNDGSVYTIHDGAVAEDTTVSSITRNPVSCIYEDPKTGMICYGTQGSTIYLRSGSELTELSCGMLGYINAIYRDSNDALWICTDSGVGFTRDDKTVSSLSSLDMNNSIEKVLEDFEGNLWFTSSRQGVMKLSRNHFSNIGHAAGLPTAVVNAVVRYDGNLYVGTDCGAYLISPIGKRLENEFTEFIGGARVRCLMVDSDQVLWASVYNGVGLVRYDGKTIQSFTTDDGILSPKIRSTMQASDGTIYIATSKGINILKDGVFAGSITEADGLTNPEVLSLCEAPDGSLLAGTDGGGVCIIQDGKVTKCLSSADGMRSDVVMRIRYDQTQNGYWFITGNCITFYDGTNIRNIDKFPYSNNLDLYFMEDHAMWILSSSGIYVTTAESMLSDDSLIYTFYNFESGLPSMPTANAYSYNEADTNRLYVAGSDSVYSIITAGNDPVDSKTKIAIPSISLDGETIWLGDTDFMEIPADVRRIKIDAYALNYSLTDPLIEYWLEEFDAKPIIVRSSQLESIAYTNLPGGTYHFRFAVLDQNTNQILQEMVLTLHRSIPFTHTLCFAVLIFLLLISLTSLMIYLLVRQRTNRLLLQQSEQQKAVVESALEKAETASHAKTDFMSRMSHDLRTPLNGIIGLTELLHEETDTIQPIEKKKILQNYLFKIGSSSNFLLGMVNDMLDIDKIQSGKIVLSPEAYSTDDLADYLRDLFTSMCMEKSIHLQIPVPDAPVTLLVDKLRLNQILTNLLSNAVKFTDAGGSVSFSQTWKENKDHQAEGILVVRDTGKGMSPDFQSHMFEPFIQEYASDTAVGSGLGLTIVHQLTELMGGSIDVESELGTGSTFTIHLTLPLTERVSRVRNSKISSDDSILNGKQILLCEDHPLNTEVATKLLEVKGMIITTAKNGKIGVETFAHSQAGFFDAILMDIRMPVMDGLTAAAAIRALDRPDAKTVPIIAMTANAFDEDKKQSFDAGMNDHIAKPIDVKVLYATLTKWITCQSRDNID